MEMADQPNPLTAEEISALVDWANAKTTSYGPPFTAAMNVARRLAGLGPVEGITYATMGIVKRPSQKMLADYGLKSSDEDE